MRLTALLLFLAAISACAPFPGLRDRGPEGVTPPPLLPIDELLALAGAPGTDPGPALAARAARLKARAAALPAP